MAVELVMPKLGLTMTEGEIISWIKNEGDAVKKGDDVLEIQTEKLTNVVAAPADGVILKILAQPGDVLPIAAALAYIGEPGEAIPESSAPEEKKEAPAAEAKPAAPAPEKAAAPSSSKEVKISPAAKTLAKKLNVDYTTLVGTGPKGRIVKEDIEAAAANSTGNAPAASAPSQGDEVVPYKGIRRAIGSGMHDSWMTSPMVTHHVQADVTNLLQLRKMHNNDLAEGEAKVGILDILTKIVANTLRKFPMVNSSLVNDEILMHKDINIGIAVALEDGLIVPVIKNADKMDAYAIGKAIKDISSKAKSNTLAGDEIAGGTFTISNIGGYNSVDAFTPIINQPEAAILGVCRTRELPAVVDGQIAVRSFMGLSFTFDHRIVDGAPAAEFLAELLKQVENPGRWIFQD